MVKKPIFDASGNQIGEGLVEQIITLGTDESFPQSARSSESRSDDVEEKDEEVSMDSQEKE